jgi:hypothetical protein
LICRSSLSDELLKNVGWSDKRRILLQQLEVKMSGWMDLLRGPALGVIAMILLIAVVVIITAFAALIAQMALLLRLRPWNTAEKKDSVPGTPQYSQDGRVPYAAVRENRQEYPRRRQSVVEPEDSEVVEGIWWEVVK